MHPPPDDEVYVALLSEARAAARGHDLARAEELARDALARDPSRAAAYSLLAVCLDLAGRHSEATDLLRAGLAVEPTYRPAEENLKRIGSYPRATLLLGDERGGR